MAEIHVEDYGTLIKFAVKDANGIALDVSLADSMIARFERPDKTTFEDALEFETTGVDGLLAWKSAQGEVIQEGSWRAQVIITFPDGIVPEDSKFHSSIVKFKVVANIAAP